MNVLYRHKQVCDGFGPFNQDKCFRDNYYVPLLFLLCNCVSAIEQLVYRASASASVTVIRVEQYHQ